jgi:fluoroacetyl-CoA thioesterase
MDCASLRRTTFEMTHLVNAEGLAPGALGRQVPGRMDADPPIAAMSTCDLVALLEMLCLCEVRCHVDPSVECVVENAIQCRHWAPIPHGTLLRIRGWVQGTRKREVTFRVQAHDAHEQVCDGTVRLVFAHRLEIVRRVAHKRAAIARRALFFTA